MAMRLRQVVLVAHDLDRLEAEIVEGLAVEACVHDLGVGKFGLRNVLFPVGDTLLEVVSPVEDGTAAGRHLVRRGGDGGYMVIVQTDDLEGLGGRLDDLAVRVVQEARMGGIRGRHLHPADVGGAILSVDEADDWTDWPWAGPDWREHRRTELVSGIVAVEIQADDPTAMAERWGGVLGRQVDGTVVRLDDGEVRFLAVMDDRGEGLAGVEVRAHRDADLEIGGVRFALRTA
jgi:hypothetical protein